MSTGPLAVPRHSVLDPKRFQLTRLHGCNLSRVRLKCCRHCLPSLLSGECCVDHPVGAASEFEFVWVPWTPVYDLLLRQMGLLSLASGTVLDFADRKSSLESRTVTDAMRSLVPPCHRSYSGCSECSLVAVACLVWSKRPCVCVCVCARGDERRMSSLEPFCPSPSSRSEGHCS